MSKVHSSFIGQLPLDALALRGRTSFTQGNGADHTRMPSSSFDFPFDPWKETASPSGYVRSPGSSSFLAQAVKRERHRIARDLHDHVGQYVVGIMLRLAAIEQLVEDNNVRTQLSELRPMLAQFAQELKAISSGANVEIPSGAELIPAFSDMIKRWERTTLIEARFEYDSLAGLEADVNTAEVLFRVVQEALTNIAKHATGATFVTVRLENTASELILNIEDDGPGFDAPAVTYYRCDGVHQGVAGMRERVRELGGTFRIRSPLNQNGTLITVILPLNHH